MRKIASHIFMVLLLLAGEAAAQFTITTTSNATSLVNLGLLGTGVQATNITGQLGSNSSGTFTSSGITGMPFASGILLSNGSLVSLNFSGPSSLHFSTDLGLSGDPTLDSVVAPYPTQDAVIIEFDFSVAGDSVQFDFIFSSEEYNDYANTNFNDVFGFFVTGPGYSPNTNVALIPGTSIPIAINTVNNGGPVSGAGTGPCMNCAYYVDNAGLNNVALAPDGFTVPIQIKFAVQPCTDYHFKIAIADVNDGIFDSQVFLNEGSFQACPLQVSANGMYLPTQDTAWLCPGGSLTLEAPISPAYSWTNAATTQAIVVTQPGAYGYTTFNAANSCIAFSDMMIVAMADSVPTPVLSNVSDTIYSSITQAGLTYSWSLNGMPVSGATQPFLVTTQLGCYTLTVTNQAGCDATSNVFCLTSLSETIDSKVIIRPHPVSGISIVEMPFGTGAAATIEVFDTRGLLIRSMETKGSSSVEFNSNGLARGLYTMTITEQKTGRKIFSKVVVQ